LSNIREHQLEGCHVSDITKTVDTYLAMWNEIDPARRGEHIERAWASDGRYVDPQLEAEGHTALNDMVAAVQARFPGHRFRRVSGIDNHHGQLRFAWELAAPSGSIVVAGIDVGELRSDGRLQRMTGFFGELPARAA
jgi:hypothetical protein